MVGEQQQHRDAIKLNANSPWRQTNIWEVTKLPSPPPKRREMRREWPDKEVRRWKEDAKNFICISHTRREGGYFLPP